MRGCGSIGLATVAAALLVACAAQKAPPATPDTSGAPIITEGQHVVAQRIAPDTLVATDGAWCVVRPAGKWAAADSGRVYEACAWQPPGARVRAAVQEGAP